MKLQCLYFVACVLFVSSLCAYNERDLVRALDPRISVVANCDLSGARIEGRRFWGKTFDHVSMDAGVLVGCSFYGCTFINYSIQSRDGQRACWDNCNFINCNFYGCNANGLVVQNCNLRSDSCGFGQFIGCYMQNLQCNGGILDGITFKDCCLNSSSYTGITFSKFVRFICSELVGAVFSSGHFSDCFECSDGVWFIECIDKYLLFSMEDVCIRHDFSRTKVRFFSVEQRRGDSLVIATADLMYNPESV